MSLDATIMMPLYNVEKFLEESLESALSQNYKGDYEIVAVNDGSKDKTLEIAQKYKNKYKDKITLINQENGGAGAARNKILDYSRGNIVINLDGDDRLHPNAVSKVVDFFNENPQVNFAYSNHIEIDEEGKFLEERRKEKLHKYFNELIFHTFFPVHLQAYRQKAIGRNRYDTTLKMAEDYDFALRFLLPENPVYRAGHIGDFLYDYRVNKNGITHTNDSSRAYNDTSKVVTRYLKTNKVYGEEGRYISVQPGKEAGFLIEHKLKDTEIRMDPKAKEVIMEFIGRRRSK